MQLIYLSLANLKDRLFMRDFVHNFKWNTETLILHEPFGNTVADTLFVTKRISSLLSEALVNNSSFSAAQRDFFYIEKGEIKVAANKITALQKTIPLLILGPIVKENGIEILANAQQMVLVAKKTFDIQVVTTFTDNPLSPLAGKKILVENDAIYQQYLAIYEEEKNALSRALAFAPANLCSPHNYSK